MQLFQQSEVNLRKIALVGNAPGDPVLPVEERKIRLNVMKRFAMEMQALVKQFRNLQQKFIMRTNHCLVCFGFLKAVVVVVVVLI